MESISLFSKTEATKEGLRTYLGSFCKKDISHGWIRYSSNGACVGCVKSSASQWAKDNPEKAREHNRNSTALWRERQSNKS